MDFLEFLVPRVYLGVKNMWEKFQKFAERGNNWIEAKPSFIIIHNHHHYYIDNINGVRSFGKNGNT